MRFRFATTFILVGVGIYWASVGDTLPDTHATRSSTPSVRETGTDPEPETDDSPRPPPLAVETPGELRRVLRYCRNAGKLDRGALRRMALSPDPLVAGNAISALGRMGAVLDDDAILALLTDPRLRVRQSVIAALGDSGSSRATTLLVPLLDQRSRETRPLVIQALGKLGATNALRGVLRDDLSTKTERVFARSALAQDVEQRR